VGYACFAGWVGHEGELPGYNTTVYYDTESDTVVVVQANSDISSGTCTDSPTLADDPHTETCSTPAARVFMELSKVLGREFVPNDKN
jgi:D-alanyl-D-alanine carboxypeptidase